MFISRLEMGEHRRDGLEYEPAYGSNLREYWLPNHNFRPGVLPAKLKVTAAPFMHEHSSDYFFSAKVLSLLGQVLQASQRVIYLPNTI
jgi:hypothetical protein